jgi:hypothetical protein
VAAGAECSREVASCSAANGWLVRLGREPARAHACDLLTACGSNTWRAVKCGMHAGAQGVEARRHSGVQHAQSLVPVVAIADVAHRHPRGRAAEPAGLAAGCPARGDDASGARGALPHGA